MGVQKFHDVGLECFLQVAVPAAADAAASKSSLVLQDGEVEEYSDVWPEDRAAALEHMDEAREVGGDDQAATAVEEELKPSGLYAAAKLRAFDVARELLLETLSAPLHA